MISILTISKDDFHGLQKTLKSTKNLDLNEHLVVLGGQDRKSEKIAYDHTFAVFRDSGQGISMAFNLGLSHAQGLAILFLNGGDVLLQPDALEIGIQKLISNDALDIVFYDSIFGDALIGNYLYQVNNKFIINFNRIGMGMPCSHQAMLIRRSCFDEIGFFDPSYKIAMDYEWLCRWVKIKGQTSLIEKVESLSLVSVDGTGISVQQEPLCLYEGFKALKKNKLLMPRVALDYMNRLSRFLVRYALYHLRLSFLVVWIKRRMHAQAPF